MIPTWLQKIATGHAVVIALVLWLGYAMLFFTLGPYSTLQSAGGGDLLEETFGYDTTEAQERLRVLAEDGRNTYGKFQLLDALNAVLMTVALTLSLAFTLSRLLAARNPLRLLVYLPVLVGACELIENSLLLAMLSSFPSEATAAGKFAGPVTSAKLVVAFVALPITVLSFVALGIKALRDRSKAKHEPHSEGR
jgi:hypothetical protein